MKPEEAREAMAFLKKEIAKRPNPVILVVEDDPNDIQLLMRQLRGFICTPLVATDTATAVKIIDEQDINVVLLDLKLPVVPGVEVIKQTKHLDPDLHFIAVTGAKDAAAMNEAIEAGAVLILEKPVTFEQLSSMLTPKPSNSE